MKKFTFLLALAAFCTSTTFAQSHQIISDIDNIFGVGGKIIGNGDDVKTFYAPNHFQIQPKKNQSEDAIITFDLNSQSIHKTKIVHESNYQFIHAIQNEDEVVSFFNYFDKKQQKYSICINKASKQEAEAAWNPTELFSVSTDKKDNRFIKTAISPDDSKIGILLLGSERKGAYEGSILFVADNQGEVLWQSTLEANFANKTFGILDFVIDNEGDAYTLVNSYTENGKSYKNEQLHVFYNSQNDSKVEEIDFSLGNIQSAKALFKKDGSMLIGGFYKGNAGIHGSFSIPYDMQAGQMGELNHQDFPKSYVEKDGVNFFTTSISNQKCQAATIGMYEYADGTVVLMGELHGIVEIISTNGQRNYAYHSKNITYNFIDKDGNLSETEMIYKDLLKVVSVYGAGFGDISYKCIFKDNTLYFFYEELLDNLDGKGSYVVRNGFTPNKQRCTLICSLTDDKVLESKILWKCATNKRGVLSPLFLEDDGVVVFDGELDKSLLGYKKPAISKITF